MGDHKHCPGEDYEETVRSMFVREDELTHQRMIWMATFNGLLFAALGFAWGKNDFMFLTITFAVLGVASSLLNGIALVFASFAQRKLLEWWRLHRPGTYAGPGVMAWEPPDKHMLSIFITPWLALAIAFTIGWGAILAYVLGMR